MAVSKNQNLTRIIKFGKLPAKRDDRNLKLSAILKVLPKFPPEYDFDVQHNGIPTPMFGNDYHGDCVIAGRAHQTLRFEDAEQGRSPRSLKRKFWMSGTRRTGGRKTASMCSTRSSSGARRAGRLPKRTTRSRPLPRSTGKTMMRSRLRSMQISEPVSVFPCRIRHCRNSMPVNRGPRLRDRKTRRTDITYTYRDTPRPGRSVSRGDASSR